MPLKMKRDSIQQTINEFRDKNDNYEKIALINSVIEINKEIAKVKYYNNNCIFDSFILDKLVDIEYVK